LDAGWYIITREADGKGRQGPSALTRGRAGATLAAMRRPRPFLLLLVLLLLPLPLLATEPLPQHAALDLAVLRAAYPGATKGLERDASGRLTLVLANGQRLPYDDGRPRTPQQALDDPDVRTMLAQVYPLGPLDEATSNPAPHFDPGRSRVQALFLALYGASEAAVRASCRSVRFDNHGAIFQKRFGAADALERVWKRLEPQLPAHPEWLAVLRPFGGTLCWRRIAGTGRLSAHSFGVAVDLNPRLPYWRGEKHLETMPQRRLAFPPEIVAAFEAEGFLWGGKWAGFDLMHFEYRPELILKARVLRGEITLP
jgi:hypothetical protein